MLIIAAEQPSALCDWTDRSSCILFGDGAGAVLLEDSGEGECLSTVLRTEFNAEFLNVEMPANNNPFSERKGEGRWLQMNGQEVYRFAVSSCVSDLNEAAQKAGIALESVDWFLAHLKRRQDPPAPAEGEIPRQHRGLRQHLFRLHPAAHRRDAQGRQAPGRPDHRPVRLRRGADPRRGRAAAVIFGKPGKTCPLQIF